MATSAALWNPPAFSALPPFALTASRTVANLPRGVHGSSSGRKVETTKKIASKTVIVCVKISQSFCMENPTFQMNRKSIMHQNILENYLNDLLNVQQFHDYCPNGLQVEGRVSIQKLISGVTASQALIQAALDLQADAIIVHHGYFWRGENACLRGIKRHRIATLIKHDINLYAYHLPLDAHAELGNNSLLGKKLGIKEEGRFGEQNIAAYGSFQQPIELSILNNLLNSVLDREPLIIGDPLKTIQRVAWCTGAAQGCFDEAIQLGVDAFITGEISEQNVHTARESGTIFISAGHHATERYGIQALGDHIAQKFGIAHHFIDIENPV